MGTGTTIVGSSDTGDGDDDDDAAATNEDEADDDDDDGADDAEADDEEADDDEADETARGSHGILAMAACGRISSIASENAFSFGSCNRLAFKPSAALVLLADARPAWGASLAAPRNPMHTERASPTVAPSCADEHASVAIGMRRACERKGRCATSSAGITSEVDDDDDDDDAAALPLPLPLPAP